MANARGIINRALLLISAIGKGQVVPADEAQDGLVTLNSMLSSWSVDGLLVFNETREILPLTIGKTSYTIGVGGDFNTLKPKDILSAFVRIGSYDYNLTKKDSIEYGAIINKTIGGAYPSIYNYIPNDPLGIINILDFPSQAMNLHLYSNKALTSFINLTTDVTLGDGYERAIVYNLALEIAPEYQVAPSMGVINIAGNALRIIKDYNAKRNSFVTAIQGVPQSITINNAGDGNIYSG